jgi:hypothetical protein
MDYFVSINNTQYHHWQLELLIESFKAKGIEDDLFVSLSNATNQRIIDEKVLHNFFSHDKKHFLQENIGEKKGFLILDKFYSLVIALISGRVKQPFCFLEPDLVLHKSVSMTLDSPYLKFIFSVDPFFTLELSESNVGPFCEWLNIPREKVSSNWLPIGEAYIFDKFPISFFYELLLTAEDLYVHQKINNKKVWDKTPELALILSVIKYMPNVYCKGSYELVSPINSSQDSHFISYKSGIPPNFHKSMFRYDPPFFVSFGDPLRVLSESAFSPNSKYVSKIAKSSIESRSEVEKE